MDRETFQSLVASLADQTSRGVIPERPILVREIREGHILVHEIVDGEQRWKAYKLIHRYNSRAKIPVITLGPISRSEARHLSLIHI